MAIILNVRKYKLAIKTTFCEYENIHNKELYQHFLNKEMPEFWKCWSTKFRQNSAKDVHLNVSNRDSDIVNAFAFDFSST